MTITSLRKPSSLLGGLSTILAVTCLALIPTSEARAQTSTPKPRRGNIVQRHPNAAGAGVGVGVHNHLKKNATRARSQGKRPGFAERHPNLSGAAAGMATHHALKKSSQKAASKP